jgi:hypothetical protein
MPHNMAFTHTERQFLDGSKTVTRRLGWRFLKPGDQVMAVRTMGRRKGSKAVPLGLIEVLATRVEPLNAMLEDLDYGRDECRREGFAGMTPEEFVAFFLQTHLATGPRAPVTRIVFMHRPDRPDLSPTVWGERSGAIISEGGCADQSA